MKRLLPLSVLLLVAVCQHPTWAVQDPAAPPLEIDHEQTINVVLEERLSPLGSSSYQCRIIGEPVLVGTRVRFNFNISNSGTQDVIFDGIETGCGCFQMKCEKAVIPANGATSVKAVADYFVQLRLGEQYEFNIQFTQGKKPICFIHLTGPLQGVLSIPQVPAMESTGDFSEWRIPIVVTKPVELNRLQVQLSESLKDLVAKVAVVDGKPVILVSGPTANLGVAGIIGEVMVRDPELEIRAATRVSFLKRPIVRISPLNIRLVRNSEDEIYSANVLVQAVDQIVENGSDKVKNLIQTIECHADKHELQVSKTRINDQLYRVKLTLTPAADEDLDEVEFPIEWKVVSLLGVWEVSGTGSVLK